MSQMAKTTQQHPAENSSWLSLLSLGIVASPADLLKAWSQIKSKSYVPKSKIKAGVFQPVEHDESVSLLWGPKFGFKVRCRRDIMAMPPSLLTHQPTFGLGYDGRAVCLAYAILARNKGLKPWTLVYNLNTNESIHSFEENCIQWPRLASSMRRIYCAEFERTFGDFGELYVNAATELALLLADTDDELVEDWLDGTKEHQDLKVNSAAAKLEATATDLNRLYKGKYAAMLVNLGSHVKGDRIRPEIFVYNALCQLEGVSVESQWVSQPLTVERREQEEKLIGVTGQALISAIV